MERGKAIKKMAEIAGLDKIVDKSDERREESFDIDEIMEDENNLQTFDEDEIAYAGYEEHMKEIETPEEQKSKVVTMEMFMQLQDEVKTLTKKLAKMKNKKNK